MTKHPRGRTRRPSFISVRLAIRVWATPAFRRPARPSDGASPAAPLGDIQQHEQVQTGEQGQGERAFFAIVVQLALEYKISAIRLAVCPVMRSWPTSDLKRDRHCQILKQYALGLLLSMLSRMNRSAGFPSGLKSPDFFWGISQTGFLDEQSLHHILGKLKPGVNELMCHPGYVDQTPREFPTRLLSQREIEMEALTSPAVRKTIKARQINMIHYGNI